MKNIEDLYLLAMSLLGSENRLAFDLFEEAALGGHIEAAYRVGDCYHFGEGVASDTGVAYVWYLFAAKKGHSAAMYNVATMHRFGSGIFQDDNMAIMWYEKAAVNYAQAALALADMYCKSTLKDFNKAAQLYEDLAISGSVKAAEKLLDLYKSGKIICKKGDATQYCAGLTRGN